MKELMMSQCWSIFFSSIRQGMGFTSVDCRGLVSVGVDVSLASQDQFGDGATGLFQVGTGCGVDHQGLRMD